MSRLPAVLRCSLLVVALLAFSACSMLRAPTTRVKPTPASQTTKGGGYYKDDGPGDEIPANLDAIPNAVPRVEPLHKGASRPYTVLGKSYVPQTKIQTFRQEGLASWYGKKFHGQKTSIGETYDMFAMTAAHTTLALPSYARVSNPKNGRSIVVRVNDRGPFHAGRVIDLSYTAAYKLGFIESGSGPVVVESIVPGTPLFAALAAKPATVAAPSPSPAPAPTPIHIPVPASAPASPEPDSQALDALALSFSADDSPDTETQTSVTSESASGFFLQLGAFSQPENAENLKERLLRELDWLSDPVFIQSDGNFYRLQTGPYASRETALEIAERIRATFGQSPTLVIR
ncbi:MAG: septal ring lytic transglycosylase RlpA family protein [Betaproteobacteria bacterium]|nr:septal ring lytic transglycosylase RlpA family protein [Betaproteobacteria bacterium]